MSTLAASDIEAYLTRIWQRPVRVEDLARIPGGASRETYRFDAVAGEETHRLILRREPVKGLIDTETATEFRAYQSAAGVVPVPRAVALEPEGAELGRPFFIMERIDGGEVAGSFARDPFGVHGAGLGEAFFGALGRLAAHDPAGTPLAGDLPMPARDECWRTALDYWEGVIEEDALQPQPIARAAIRWLRANPPPPAQRIAIVHGDYRSGNVMHDGAGQMLAMFDWEMAHLGDPLEDLGWALDPIWDHFEAGKSCGMLPRPEAMAAWERASGLTVDPAAMRWWSLFASVKGCAIWASAFREFVDGGRQDPVLAVSGWYTARRQDAIIATQLGGRHYDPVPVLPTSDLAQVLIGAGIVTASAGEKIGAGDAFAGSTLTVAALLALLGAQEAEKAAAWRRADIADMRRLLGDDGPVTGEGETLDALDSIWATLAEALIAHHDRLAETRGDEAPLLDFYRESAARRELAWPL
ncbi:phosphotransferase family protein [Sphingomonas jeddahensis]|uniref:Phosphotransferase enzyme family protein n=1 Tax=Sphingomonas jeddahensis TaxID=1915074 RepID=A0A1V2EQP3_9SPHN|nr:phosphotransferase family protein [Sphingomonas jeddahensis]ONF94992.1 Phosphotransferase enzyme family protein [Sphingomonas jeddahensis]